MEKQDAINIIKQVCSVYKGTIEEHNVIQQAIKLLEEVKNDNRKTPSSK